jgi:hypothetical protein
MKRSRLAVAHGLFNMAAGLWPLLHYRSFEAVSGPKADDWLVKCVGGLIVGAGYAQMSGRNSPEGLTAARRIGVGTAGTFAAVDLIYGGSGRISRVYLLDAVVEAMWLRAWAKDLMVERYDCPARPIDQRRPIGPATVLGVPS